LDGELAADAARELDTHIMECANCRDRLRRLRAVSAAVDQYSTAFVASAPAGLRQDLMAAMRERQDKGTKRLYAMLAAAALILAAGIGFLVSRPPKAPVRVPHMVADAFIDLPYSDENLSGEGAVVLQVELPRSAVALAGIPVSDGPADGR